MGKPCPICGNRDDHLTCPGPRVVVGARAEGEHGPGLVRLSGTEAVL